MIFHSRFYPAICLILALGQARGVDPPPSAKPAEISLEEKLFIASKIYASLPIYFAHFQGVPELKLDEVYKQYLRETIAAKDRREFDLASMAFLAAMKNGHTEFWDPWLIETQGQSLGIKAGHYENQWVILGSTNPLLPSGEIIVRIDGKSAEDFFQEKKRFIAASSEREARDRFFSMPYLFPSPLKIKLGSGKELTVERQPVWSSFLLTPMVTEGKWLKESEIAYIKIPSFDHSRFQKRALELVESYKKAKVLVIDLRGNGGGSTPGALIGKLMDRPYQTSSFVTPEMNGLTMVRFGKPVMKMTPSQTLSPKTDAFTGRVILLIDRKTGSAAEDFAMPFKANGRATLIGETTCGSTGQPFVHKLPNGSMFRISTKREMFPDGKMFEGVGIAPDLEVIRKIADIRKGSDPVLEKAMEISQGP